MPNLRIEHIAFNVSDPVAMADWYVENLGMRIARQGDAPQHVRFLADTAGKTVVEIYNNPGAPIPDYAGMNPFTLHVAFHADDPDAAKAALVAAGATFVDQSELPDGSRLMFLRDPWGLTVQLVRRAKPLL